MVLRSWDENASGVCVCVCVCVCACVCVGTLMGITNAVATIPGFVSPTVVGLLTHGNVSHQY